MDLEVSSKVEGSVNDSKSFEGIQDELEKEVGHVFLSFKTAIFVFKIILSLSLGLIFFQSFWYLRNYLAKDAYDNIYITSQFKKLDKENAEKGVEAILPLKKKERSIYVDTSSFKLNATELVHCRLGLAQVFLHFILCVMVVLFDYSLYFVLRLIEKNGNIQIKVEGEGRFTVEVKGHGPVADFYKIMVQGFNLDQTYSSSLDVRNCLPRPGQPSGAILLSLVLLYLIALAFVVLRGYGMRLRRKIAAYYYPEQERMRLEYLHKKIRHKRIGFLKFLRHQIQSAQKENDVKQRFRISAWLAFKFPALERFFPSHDKVECTSCEQKESSFQGIVLTKCPGQTGGMPCDAVYCQECKSALNNVCPLCFQDAVVLRN